LPNLQYLQRELSKAKQRRNPEAATDRAPENDKPYGGLGL